MTNEALKEQFDLKNPYEIAKYIKAVEKTTPVKAFIKGYLRRKDLEGMNYFGDPSACIILGEAAEIGTLIEEKAASISFCKVEYDRRNSAIPLLDLTAVDARIEPGAFIREGVHIGKNAVVMMGAVINIGAEIGDGSMIDMNAVLGARAKVGKNCHIGAGAVLAGVLEPPSKEPVSVGDGVVIGANAVILEGVQIGENAVVAAGAVVTQDVPAGVVVAGSPAKVVKEKDEKTEGKTELLDDLRG
ncbi:2,3,4,5-tetrahydropyridine-2,6-dicarboxylate N-acetyltransferase [Eubacterium aggregans]|uniref:2,3,4,5-tetrahydropyridine-2,6-dicarboxylate N-acetyltransferase n=1 Tax=Eubacterium aggregans TaxID=81409 RepID=A0A1H3Y4J7_9FIRM|nr:2,3,4,5-tetrahydropyridine-2,6-dicarboxylate N-acetyltransferase [Eubacterium aggregans]SEA06539.1 2,3,4,5-tetrahydropyridine-2,6-dicarboxylate N-acetyltransferase [Eubacterium aggregans]